MVQSQPFQLGMLVVVGLCVLMFWAVSNRVVLVRWILREEPVHTLATIRIVLPIVAVVNVALFSDCHEFLFSSEGLLSGEDARDRFSTFGLTSTNDGGWTRFGGPNFSLFYVHDDPAVVHSAVLLFYLSALSYSLGFFTRASGVVSFFLMNSILARNLFFWEGTELVIRCFYFCLILSECGRVWSVDSWLAKRRGDGLSCVAPSWPRKLMMFQLGAIYLYTGLAKRGVAWVDGDAVYYAMGMDHFSRFALQSVMSTFGSDVLRCLTWSSRLVESLFPVCILGVLNQEILRHNESKCGRFDDWVEWLASIVFAALATTALCMIWPFYVAPFDVWLVASVGVLSVSALVLGKSFQRQTVLRRKIGAVICSRRLWVGATVVLQLGIMLVLNIGVFQPAMLVASLSMVRGDELCQMLGLVSDDAAVLEREDLVGSIGSQRGWYSVAVLLTMSALAGYQSFPVCSMVSLVAASVVLLWDAGRRNWGSVVVLLVFVYHLLAICIGLIPQHVTTEGFRSRLLVPFETWIALTQTEQSWGMFAPNPPKVNVFLRARVYAGRSGWDLETDIYGRGRFPLPYLHYERWRKIARRLSGGETDENAPELRERFAGYICEHWRDPVSGDRPKYVDLERVWYRVPSPEVLQERGWYESVRVRKGYARSDRLLHFPCGSSRVREGALLKRRRLESCCAFGLGYQLGSTSDE